MKRRRACVIAVILLVFSLGACSQAKDDSIVGKWDIVGTVPVAVDGNKAEYWEFAENGFGKVVYTDGSEKNEFRYELNEDEVTIYRVDNENFYFSYTKKGREMYLDGTKELEKQ